MWERFDVEKAGDAVTGQATVEFADEVFVLTAVAEEDAVGRAGHRSIC
jgi:hypothetical protein